MLDTNTVLQKLNFIFWGSILIIIDISYTSTSNGFGLRLDWVNDLIGAILIFNGVRYFAPFFKRDASYSESLRIAEIGAGLLILLSLLDFFILSGTLYSIFDTLLLIGAIYGVIRFCRGIAHFSAKNGLLDTSQRWQKTEQLFLWVYLVPIALLRFINLFGFEYLAFGIPTFFGWVYVIGIFLILFIPIISGLRTIAFMKREIDHRGNPLRGQDE